MEQEKEDLAESKNTSNNVSTESDSLHELISELKKYEDRCEVSNFKNDEKPIFGCLQVVAHKKEQSVAYTLSLDDDDENQILNNFKSSSIAESTRNKAFGKYNLKLSSIEF